MTQRIRLVAWTVQPHVVLDDGENLTPINVQPIDINSADWERWKAGGDAESLATLEAQVAAREKPSDEAAEPPRT